MLLFHTIKFQKFIASMLCQYHFSSCKISCLSFLCTLTHASVFLIKWTAIWKKKFCCHLKIHVQYVWLSIFTNNSTPSGLFFFDKPCFLFHTVLSLFGTTRFHGNNQHVNWESVRKKSDTEITTLRLKPLWSRWGLWDQNTFCCYCSCCYCCFLSVFTELWYKGKCVWIMTTDEIQMWNLFVSYTIVLWNEAMFKLHFPVLRWIHSKDKWHNLAVRTCPASLLHYIFYLLFFCCFFFCHVWVFQFLIPKVRLDLFDSLSRTIDF